MCEAVLLQDDELQERRHGVADDPLQEHLQVLVHKPDLRQGEPRARGATRLTEPVAAPLREVLVCAALTAHFAACRSRDRPCSMYDTGGQVMLSRFVCFTVVIASGPVTSCPLHGSQGQWACHSLYALWCQWSVVLSRFVRLMVFRGSGPFTICSLHDAIS